MAGERSDPETKLPEEAASEKTGGDPDSGTSRPSLWKRLKPLHDRIASRPSSGLVADKAFYDSLNDE